MNTTLENVMKTTMENLKGMVDVNTVVGTPVTSADGSTLIPVSRVSFGFVSGGGEYPCQGKEDFPFAGGSGAGISLNPVGFLCVSKDNVRMMPAQHENPLEHLMEIVPQVMENVQKLIKECCAEQSEYPPEGNA